MDTFSAILLSMLLPAVAVISNLIFRNSPNLRDGLTLGAAVATFLVVLNILNNVGNNIKCGNTLVSTDITTKYPQITSNQEQLFRTNAFDYNSSNGFSEIFNNKGGFDYIVGNPPYVEVKNYNLEYPFMHKYLKENYTTTKKDKIDLSVAFIEKGVSILNEKGEIGLIIQKRFFKTNYGYDVREFIGSNNLLSQVINFKSTNIFKGMKTVFFIIMITQSNFNIMRDKLLYHKHH